MSNIDHDLVLSSIIEYGGHVRGSYVRSWILNGEPSDHGWGDLDVFGVPPQLRESLKNKIGDQINNRVIEFWDDSDPWNFHYFNCNSWIYDGILHRKYINDFSDEEVLDQINKKKAVLISDKIEATSHFRIKVLKYIQRYKMTIHYSNMELVKLNDLGLTIHQFMHPMPKNSAEIEMMKDTWGDGFLGKHIIPTVNNIYSFGASMHKWASGGMQKTDDATLQKRIEVCSGCDLWDRSGFNGTGRCTKCGCSTWAKLRMDTEKCPIDKW